jgi:gliding motility-associated-like protein
MPIDGTPPYKYVWTNGQITQTATGLAVGNYSVIITDANGCTMSSFVKISSPSNFSSGALSVSDTCGQKKGKAHAVPSGGIAPYSYLWLTSPVQSSSAISGVAAGSYSCILTDSKGCTSLSSVSIGNIPGPVVDFSMNPMVVDVLNPTITLTDLSVSNITFWQWSFGDGGVSASANPNHTYQKSGMYAIKLMVKDKFGCKDSIVKNILVESAFTFYVPNTITPNEDGLNDIFLPKYTEISTTDYSLFIFDRWGNRIFTSADLKTGWNGKFKNETVQEDVYVYVISYKDFKSKEHKLIGSVNVVH